MPIGNTNDNPGLDTRIYEVEYPDRYKAALAKNTIALNFFDQVDAEGNIYVLFDKIVDHRIYGTEIKLDEQFITSSNSSHRIRSITKGWEVLVQWKDDSSTWEILKDMKE